MTTIFTSLVDFSKPHAVLQPSRVQHPNVRITTLHQTARDRGQQLGGPLSALVRLRTPSLRTAELALFLTT